MKQKNNILKNLIRNVGTWRAMSATKKTNTGLARRTWHAMYLQALAIAALTLSACSMINEELPECAPAPNTEITVKFVYDYNMKYTDLLKEHAGSVYLYSFDQDSVFLRRDSLHKVDMNGEIDFTMHFDTTAFKPGRTYHMVAMAQGNHVGYEASLETPGFVPVHPMVEGQTKLRDYIIKLDRDDDGTYDFGIVNYKDAYGNNQEMIDTVWSTKPDEVQTIHIPYIEYKPTAEPQPDNHYEVTIPMMRLTNAITVNLLSGSFTENTNTEAYHVLIHFPNGNGTIDFTGTTYPAQPLYYQTLRKNMVVYTPLSQRSTKADEIVAGSNQWALQSEFGVSRLQMNDESSLQIRDAKTDEMVAEIPNFSKFLANAFDYYGQENGQEFLDREYEFEVTLALKDPGVDNPGGDDPGTDPDPGPGGDDPGTDPDPGPGDDPGTDPDPGPGIDDPTDNWEWIEIYVKVADWYVRINRAIF